MVQSCSAYGCTNRWKSKKSLQFHRFPLNDPKRLQKWLMAVKRASWMPSKTSHLCSDHFTSDAYKSDAKRYLKDDAVPSVFNFSPQLQKVRSNIKCKLPSLEMNESLTPGNAHVIRIIPTASKNNETFKQEDAFEGVSIQGKEDNSCKEESMLENEDNESEEESMQGKDKNESEEEFIQDMKESDSKEKSIQKKGEDEKNVTGGEEKESNSLLKDGSAERKPGVMFPTYFICSSNQQLHGLSQHYPVVLTMANNLSLNNNLKISNIIQTSPLISNASIKSEVNKNESFSNALKVSNIIQKSPLMSKVAMESEKKNQNLNDALKISDIIQKSPLMSKVSIQSEKKNQNLNDALKISDIIQKSPLMSNASIEPEVKKSQSLSNASKFSNIIQKSPLKPKISIKPKVEKHQLKASDPIFKVAFLEGNMVRLRQQHEKDMRRINLLSRRESHHIKRISTLTKTINTMKNQKNTDQEKLKILENASPFLLELLSRQKSQNADKTITKEYSSEVRDFVENLYAISPNAYRYVRNYFGNSLPHINTVTKWRSKKHNGLTFNDKRDSGLNSTSDNLHKQNLFDYGKGNFSNAENDDKKE